MVVCTLLTCWTVEGSIHPGTDAEVILLRAACIMSECPRMNDDDGCNANLVKHLIQRAKLFVEFFMHNHYGHS